MTKAFDPTYLKTAKQPARRHITCYQVVLTSGQTMRFCDADTDIVRGTTRDSTPATFRAFGHDRQALKTNATLQVDTVDIGFPNAMIPYAGLERRLGELAVNGLFDKATLYIFIADLDHPEVVAQADSFWVVQQATVTRTDVQFRCESLMAIAMRQVPRTVFQAECNNDLFDQWCGLLRVNFTDNVTALGTSTQSILYFTSARLTGWFDNGEVVSTSGLNAGLRRTVQLSTATAGTMEVVFLQPWPFAVQAGDTFSVVPGCDKAIGTCKNKFNNLYGPGGSAGAPNGGYRGFPSIPKPTDTI